MHWTLRRLLCPAVVTVGLAGLLVGGLLVGFEPVGGDPDRLYRPLKEEFARFWPAVSCPSGAIDSAWAFPSPRATLPR